MRPFWLLLLAACVLAGPARAHAILLGSDPAIGSTVAPGPARGDRAATLIAPITPIMNAIHVPPYHAVRRAQKTPKQIPGSI